MAFFLISWKEFREAKMADKSELIKELDGKTALNNMREYNAQRRLTTTDYAYFNLTELFDRKGLQITEKIEEVALDGSDIITEEDLKIEPVVSKTPEKNGPKPEPVIPKAIKTPEVKAKISAEDKALNMTVD